MNLLRLGPTDQLFTERQDQLIRIFGSARLARDGRLDVAPFVRLVSDDLAIAWYITDCDPRDHNRLYGLTASRHSCQVGTIDRAELHHEKRTRGLYRDPEFQTTETIAQMAHSFFRQVNSALQVATLTTRSAA